MDMKLVGFLHGLYRDSPGIMVGSELQLPVLMSPCPYVERLTSLMGHHFLPAILRARNPKTCS